MDPNTTDAAANASFVNGLWDLPSQPLPRDKENGARIAVIIWLLFTCFFTALFYNHVSKFAPSSPMKRGTRCITWAAILLSLRYIFLVIDRWLHFKRTKSPFGYIIFDAIFEPFDLASTILILWGTYLLVASQVKGFTAPKRSDLRWWTPRIAAVVLWYVTIAYVVLYLAHVCLWLQFAKLQVIQDLAQSRKTAELAMRVMFFLATLFLLAVVIFGWVTLSKIHGGSHEFIRYLSAAAFFLFIRNTFTLGVYGPKGRRESLLLERDVVYGLFSQLYFAFAYLGSRGVASDTRDDRGSREYVEADVRSSIIRELKDRTEDHVKPSPPFIDLINEERAPIIVQRVIAEGPTSRDLGLDDARRRAWANAYIDSLRSSIYIDLNPRLGINFQEVRPGSVVDSLKSRLGRTSANDGRKSASSRKRWTGSSRQGGVQRSGEHLHTMYEAA